MRSTFYGFEIAKSGLFASQQNLNITGHNISNVNTKGYTRQRLNVQAVPAPFYMGMVAYSDKSMSGQGVRMMYVDQIRDPFLDIQYREENTSSKNWETQEYEFSMIEALFNFEITDDESGISNLFADFYASLHKLAEKPSDLEVRQAVLGSAMNMVAIMNQNADKILDQYNDINEAINASVLQINSITRSIAALNNQIFGFELSGAQANDLRDQRNLLLDELSGYIPISYRETTDNYLIVEYNGVEIINHSKQKDLALASTKDHAFTAGAKVYELYFAEQLNPDGTVAIDPDTGDVYAPISEDEGIIGGYFKMRDGDSKDNVGLPYVMGMLDELCQKVANEFNAVHEQGWSMPGGGEVSATGIKFFKDDVPITALNFALHEDINIYRIAASDAEIVLGSGGAGGDNEQRNNNVNALKIVDLLSKTDAAGNQDNFDSKYKEIIVAVGLEMSYINRMNNNQATVLASIEDRRQSVSGVSIDEEVTNVIKYGHSYNAASRVITAIDEQLDTVINKMGLVGR